MDKTTILYVTDVFNKMAGAEKNLFEVAARLNPLKFKPIVICLMGGEVVELLRSKGIEVIDLKLKKIYSPRAIIKSIQILRLIKQRNVKIVITYHESSDFLFSIIAKLANVPVIISSRRDMGYKLKKRHIFAYRLLNMLFNRIVTVSEAVKNEVFKRENVLWSKLVTVYNGVDVEKFMGSVDKAKIKSSLGLADDWAVIGILAAIRPIKGHKYFIEAASLIIKEFPKTYFLVIGWPDGNEEYLRELKSFTKELKIEKNVLFTGGRSDTTEMLSIMDVSVLSSINEGFPNAILESMAAGKPVVGTSSGGTSEAIIDGTTGFLVPPRDSNALASAILKLLNNKIIAQEMGRAGRKRAEEIFSINRMITGIEDLYDSLLSEKLDKEAYSSVSNFNFELLKTLLIKIVKISLGNIFYYSGATFFIKRGALHNNSILILAYHRIVNSRFDPLSMNITAASFEEHLIFFNKYYNPVSLEKAVELLKGKERIPKNTIAITFDDGYKDNYTNAFPLLTKYGIPATIFLSVDAVNRHSVLWYDIITKALKETANELIDLKKFGLGVYLLNSPYEKMTAARETVSFAKGVNNKEREAFINYLLKELKVEPEKMDWKNMMLNWSEVSEMKNAGISFGSHGMTHSILSNLSEDELSLEIEDSKTVIKENTGIDAKMFAYPNGGVGDFNINVEHLLKKNAYIAACSLQGGINNGNSSMFNLKRICVTKGMESGLFSHFSKPLFTTKTLGIFDMLLKKLGRTDTIG